MKVRKFLYSGFIAGILLTAVACNDDDGEKVDDYNYSTKIDAAADNYAKIVLANYTDAYDGAVLLNSKIDTFIATPTQENFTAAKQAWLDAREVYGQTEAFRFANGPIDTDTNTLMEAGLEGQINAWPMDENYIDYTSTEPNAGLINDTSFNITKEAIVELNENGEKNISTGWHAIEFLLWGQDLYADSSGTRPYTDYIVGAEGTASNQARRGKFLKLVSEQLVEDIAVVKNEWEPSGEYFKKFVEFDNRTIVDNIFKSLKEMSKGELATERMSVAVDSGDQENEHSCFSDNTHVDIRQNFEGMVNVYEGKYTKTDGSKISGTSFADIAMEADKEKAEAVENLIDEARAKIIAIPTPFDQAILNSKTEILAATDALKDLSDAWADVEVEIKEEI